MKKKKRLTYAICSILIGVVSILIVYFLLIVFGVIQTREYKIVLRAIDCEKVYDGTPLICESWELVEGDLFDGHVLDVTILGEQTSVGESPSEIVVRIYDENDAEVTKKYDIETINGIIKVNKRPLSLMAGSDTKVYDGEPLTLNSYDIISGSLVNGNYLNANCDGEITNVGTVANRLNPEIYDMYGNVVTQNYDLTLHEGFLTINPREIVISTSSSSKVYDGIELSNGEWNLSGGSIANYQSLHVNNSGTITDVGVVENLAFAQIFDYNYEDVTSNYNISYDFGSLEVYPRQLSIKSFSSSKIYNDEELINDNYRITSGSLAFDQFMEANMYSTITDVGFINNEFTVAIFDKFNKDVTYNYDINYDYGYLEVLPIQLYITTDSNIKEYDGNPLTDSDYKLGVNNVLSHHSLQVKNNGEITEVGAVENTTEIFIEDRFGNDKSGNYDVSLNLGLLEVTPIDLVIETGSNEKIYDGKVLTSDSWKIVDGKVLSNNIITVNNIGRITNVGVVDNEAVVTIKKENNYVTSNYNITVVAGRLEVHPRNLTIQTENSSKIYDGTELLHKAYSFVDGNLGNNHSVTVSGFSGITDVGTTLNTANIVITDENGLNITDNYTIQTNWGSLTVNPRPLTIELGSSQKVYDGLELYNKTYNVIYGSLVANHSITLSNNTRVTNVGIYENTAKLIIRNSNGLNVTSNYDYNVESGSLIINPVQLSIESASAEKVYDGAPLMESDWELVDGTVPYGFKLYVNNSTKLINVGNVENRCYPQVLNNKGIDVTDNFDFNMVYGSLVVTPAKIGILTASDEKIYDGTPLYNHDWNVEYGDVFGYDHLIVNVEGAITLPGSVENIATAYILDGNTSVPSGNYIIEVVYGTLTVSEFLGDEVDSPTLPTGELLFKFKADIDGAVYLRQYSFGDYNGTSLWKDAEVFESNYNINPIYLSSQALIDNGYCISNCEIILNKPGQLFMHPYFTINGPSGNYNDTTILESFANVNTYQFINYDVLKDGALKINDPVYKALEEEYRSFVYDNYLFVPSSTKNGLLEIAEENNISKNSNTLIYDIRDYIQNAATYNMEYKEFPAGVDKVLYFLNVNKEGVCRHYAEAATMMYRTMGIPARYVVGFAGVLEKDTWVEFTDENGHAWVEIYVDEMGWIPVEVTGGNDDGEGGIPGGGAGGAGGSGGGAGGSGGGAGGSGGGAGGSGGGESGEEPVPMPDVPSIPTGELLFTFKSDSAGTIYLRQYSYGNYVVTGGWTEAEVFKSSYNINPLYLPTQALIEHGYGISNGEIFIEKNGLAFMIPYFTVNGPSGNYDDTFILESFDNISSYQFINYDVLVNGSLMINDPVYKALEEEYRKFVYDNYLYVPNSTKQGLMEIAVKNNIYKNNDSLIYDIRNYIQNAATYKMEYEIIPAGADRVLYFLNVSKEGVCRHYAEAATLMYRTMGIPARYVNGFASYVEANEVTEFTDENGHAWVEIYIDGMGWVPVEVTGTGSNGEGGIPGGTGGSGGTGGGAGGENQGGSGGENPGGSGGENPGGSGGENPGGSGGENPGGSGGENQGGSGGENPGEGTEPEPDDEIPSNLRQLSIAQLNRSVKYSDYLENRIPIKPAGIYEDKSIRDLLELGFTYKAEISGEATTLGKTKTKITSFTIYDSKLNDVTDKFDLTFAEGYIQLYLEEITVTSASARKVYDGKPITINDFEKLDNNELLYLDDSNLHQGHSIDKKSIVIRNTSKMINAGTYTNSVSFIIRDSNGNDITSHYFIDTKYGRITIEPIQIEIVSASASKIYDGSALTYNEYTITDASKILSNHNVIVEISGSQTEIGISNNTISAVYVIDRYGNDVKKNYSIKLKYGKLWVTPY